jgi:hypothetical protein
LQLQHNDRPAVIRPRIAVDTELDYLEDYSEVIGATSDATGHIPEDQPYHGLAAVGVSSARTAFPDDIGEVTTPDPTSCRKDRCATIVLQALP